MINQQKLSSTINWLITGAQPPKELDEIVQECAIRLMATGVPLDAFVVNGIFLNAGFRGIRTIWSKRKGVRVQTMNRDFMDDGDFLSTAQYACVSSQRMLRYRFNDDDPDVARAQRDGYKAGKYTDFIFLPLFNVDGTVSGCLEAGTQSAGGFSEEQVLALRRLQAPLARIKEYFTERRDKQMTLATYVGEIASEKVLNGSIGLGDGEKISAVILFADIAGFTDISNTFAAEDVLKVLNRFFAAVDRSVGENNGEILKFIGDGVLAIFHTPDDLTAQEGAALAAIQAIERARSVLSKQVEATPIQFRASLHLGDLFFGNVGSGDRMDFTAIGPTVNFASRMLEEASKQNVFAVCSEEFNQVVPDLNATRVDCEFKGFSGTNLVYVLTDLASE
ncbi:adenylate/guanylate cyclase domain-containing protein [Primorskyibacter sp. S87]|uniref:adenylate/guanylate cyclase domain-containing protein n=1 Tax=Primorskyibacter sp. S87 TaxID=3415126 RepID=UPI003C7CB4DD